MGLHNRARELLFKDFIERNYKNAHRPIKKELLNISPDDILTSKLEVRQYNDFQRNLTQSLDVCLKEEEHKAYRSLFNDLYNHTQPEFLSLWLFNGAYGLQLIQDKGEVPKYVKNWKVSESQIDLILSVFGKDLSNPVLLKEEQKEDFFGEVDSDIVLHPISFQKELQGFILSSQFNKETMLLKNYFNSFSKLFSMTNYLSRSKEEESKQVKSNLKYQQSILGFFQNLFKLDVFDINSFGQIATYFKTPQILIGRIQGKKFKINSSFGFKSFKPIQMTVPTGFLKEGQVSGSHLELINNHISEFKVIGINVFLRNSSTDKRSWVIFINPHKKAFEENPLISFLTDISIDVFGNKIGDNEGHTPVLKPKKMIKDKYSFKDMIIALESGQKRIITAASKKRKTPKAYVLKIKRKKLSDSQELFISFKKEFSKSNEFLIHYFPNVFVLLSVNDYTEDRLIPFLDKALSKIRNNRDKRYELKLFKITIKKTWKGAQNLIDLINTSMVN